MKYLVVIEAEVKTARAWMKKVERIEVEDSNKHYIISLLKNVSKPKSLYAR